MASTAETAALGGVKVVEDGYPLRGLKGPVGTQQDQLDVLDGDFDKLAELEQRVAEGIAERLPDIRGHAGTSTSAMLTLPWMNWPRRSFA